MIRWLSGKFLLPVEEYVECEWQSRIKLINGLLMQNQPERFYFVIVLMTLENSKICNHQLSSCSGSELVWLRNEDCALFLRSGTSFSSFGLFVRSLSCAFVICWIICALLSLRNINRKFSSTKSGHWSALPNTFLLRENIRGITFIVLLDSALSTSYDFMFYSRANWAASSIELTKQLLFFFA